MKALKGDPTFLPVVEALVALEIATGRMEQALAHAAALRDAAPDESLGHTLVGDVLIAQGRFQEGIAEYQRALAVEDDPAVVVRLYQSKLEVEPVAQALDALRAWKERHPEDFIVRRHLASAYIEAGQLDEALDEHESLLEHFPNDAGIVNNLAWLYRETGDSRAMSYAEHAYELAPQAPSVLDTLGWALVDRGEYELGCRWLPRSAVIWRTDAATAVFWCESLS